MDADRLLADIEGMEQRLSIERQQIHMTPDITPEQTPDSEDECDLEMALLKVEKAEELVDTLNAQEPGTVEEIIDHTAKSASKYNFFDTVRFTFSISKVFIL